MYEVHFERVRAAVCFCRVLLCYYGSFVVAIIMTKNVFCCTAVAGGVRAAMAGKGGTGAGVARFGSALLSGALPRGVWVYLPHG